MREFKDPTPLGRAATIALYSYMVLKALAAILHFTNPDAEDDPILQVAIPGTRDSIPAR